MKRAFSLIELLVVIAIVALLAALLFPVFAQAKRAANRTTCLSNLHQVGIAIGLYQADTNGLLPVGTIHRWQNSDGKGHVFPSDATRDVMEPLWPYARGNGVLQCPANDGAYLARWVVRIGSPKTSRLMVPDVSNVLVQCMHHLAKGWRGGHEWEQILAVDGRQGNHLVVRADLSVGLVDSQTLQSLEMTVVGGEETWGPNPKNDFGVALGVFTSEKWPPEWHPLPEDIGLNWNRGF